MAKCEGGRKRGSPFRNFAESGTHKPGLWQHKWKKRITLMGEGGGAEPEESRGTSAFAPSNALTNGGDGGKKKGKFLQRFES